MMDKIFPRNQHPVERAVRVLVGIGLLSLVFVGPKTPWGQPAQGRRTRRNKSTDKFIFRRRSKKRR